ncbi:hypothetical protein B0H13DRAFT_1860532 [Mycena leptocephala]|nr:hypothetical protein B0H13DRAFT_1860532 [Mycena leptocephala]
MKRSTYSIIFLALLAESYVLPTSPESAIVRRDEIPSPLYHATCRDIFEEIKQGSTGGKLNLKPVRHWPDEFTWSGLVQRSLSAPLAPGGFYMTPNEADARAFGAVYRERLCKPQGGLVILQATLDSSKVRAKFVVNTENEARPVWNDQNALGKSIRESFDLPPSFPNEKDTVKTAVEIADMRANPSQNKVPDQLWPVYDDFVQYDVIVGAVNQDKTMKSFMDRNLKYYPKITQGIQDPFPQVVLVTDTAMQALRDVVDVTERDPNPTQETTESLVPRIAHRWRQFNVTEPL